MKVPPASLFLASPRFPSAELRAAILQLCHVGPEITSPQEDEGVPTSINMTFILDRIIGISDPDETIAVAGGIEMTWVVPCVAQVAAMMGTPEFALILPNASKFWRPQVLHRNARFDLGLDDKITYTLAILPSKGLFSLTAYGIFTSVCDLDLALFPFDRQNCSVRACKFELGRSA